MDQIHEGVEETADEVSIVNAAEKLRDSFDEMSSLTEELSGTMTEVADGFASFSDSTSNLQERDSARIDTSTSGGSVRPVADD